MPSVERAFAEELRSSGVSLAAVYLGSVPVTISASQMVADMRPQVVLECIQHVAATVGECPVQELNPLVEKVIGDVKQENYNVDLNISSKMIKVIMKNRLIQRHPLTYFSFGSEGIKGTETENMFGYIAKNKDGSDRRCHVFSSKDVQKLIDVLTAAINVNTNDSQPKASTSNDGFAIPDAPLPRRSAALHRQSFVSNCKASPTVGDDVQGKSWYHGPMSRENAQALLTTAGDFLVRQSDHTPGTFVLSGLTTDNEHKHLLLYDTHGRVRTRDRQFSNISELIDYHVTNGMAVRSEGGNRERETSLNLIRPVPHAPSHSVDP